MSPMLVYFLLNISTLDNERCLFDKQSDSLTSDIVYQQAKSFGVHFRNNIYILSKFEV